MSISPSKNLGSASSSSSQATSPNPNSNHGHDFLRQPQQQFSQFPPSPPSRENQSLHALRISSSGGMSNDHNSGSAAPAAARESSKKVIESGRSNGKKFVTHQNSGATSHCHAIAEGGARPDQCGEKLSETTGFPNGQQTSGSVNGQTSATFTGGRKTQMVSGNHLLNFHYDPISRPQPRAPHPRRHQKRKPYNKDLFLQANYKFVVLDSGNHALESLDPDKMLRWEDIVCVRFSTPVPVQCPICLDDPLCPQITSCGHIFCFPCILRYFLIGEDDHKGECWKKCPLCFMMISSKDLYTIYIENVKQHCVGDAAEFMLLTRQKDSLTLSLKNKQRVGTNEEAPESFLKFTFTTDANLSVTKAISDLDSWLARADAGLVDDLEKLPYVCTAMEHLEQRRKCWNEQQVAYGNKAINANDFQTGACGSPPIAGSVNAGNEPGKFVGRSLSTTGNGTPILAGYTTPDKLDGKACLDQITDVIEPLEDHEGLLTSSYDDGSSMQRSFNGFRDRKDNDSYTFYQAVDGQHLILHPLNIKCLLHHYGSYDMLPHRIGGKILQLETVTQSEAMRRRYRFLSHFSLTTTFQLCEIDLKELLPSDALSPFVNEIKNREKQRKRLARKEQEEKIRAEAAVSTDCLSIAFNFAQCSHDDPPTFSMDDFEALGNSAITSSSTPMVGERKLFSNVARLGFAAGHDSPALKIDNADSLPKHEATSDSSGVTGLRNSGTPSFANIISRAKDQDQDSSKVNEMGKRGKKQSRILLSTVGGRRY